MNILLGASIAVALFATIMSLGIFFLDRRDLSVRIAVAVSSTMIVLTSALGLLSAPNERLEAALGTMLFSGMIAIFFWGYSLIGICSLLKRIKS